MGEITKKQLVELGKEYVRVLSEFKGREILKGQESTEIDYLDLIIAEMTCSVARLKIY